MVDVIKDRPNVGDLTIIGVGKMDQGYAGHVIKYVEGADGSINAIDLTQPGGATSPQHPLLEG